MYKNIKENTVVDIISPATGCSLKEIFSIKNYVKNELNLTPRIPLENELNFTAEIAENEFPINNKESRFLQLKEALQNEDSKIIWCGRGGYGSGDLLPFLEKLKPIKQNKLFIGFSDIVSISTFLQDNWGWNIICAPVLVQLARNDIEKKAENELKDLIFGQKTEFEYDLDLLNKSVDSGNPDLEISAPISGGCLSVLCGHFGGKYQINFENKFLFLEDEGEDGERLDRYFRQIIEVILKEQKLPKAILLGNFLHKNIHGSPKEKNVKIAINNFVSRIHDANLGIPIFKDKNNNLGHSHQMRPLILGASSRIVKHKDNYTISTLKC